MAVLIKYNGLGGKLRFSGASTGGFKARVSSGIDADAQSFFNRVSTAGGTLSATEQSAINTLVIALKAANIWDSMKAMYPMVGSSAAACAQNLKSSSYTGTFNGSITYSSFGISGNGSNGYMNTGLTPFGTLNNANSHISFYSRTNGAAGNSVEIGVYDQSFGFGGPFIRTKNASTNFQYGMGTSTAFNDTLSSNTDSRGHFIGTVLTTSNRRSFKNGTLSATNTTSGNADYGTTPIYILAVGTYPSNTPSLYSTKECAFASIGDGLNDTQASDFYTAIQAFQTTLNRNV